MPRSPSKCNNAAIREATRRLGQLYDDSLRPSGLRATQYAILARVNVSSRITMRELAERLVMNLSALGHTLKPLVRDGFLELVVDERDRRSKIVRLTTVGIAKLAEADVPWRKAQTAFEAAYGFEAAEQLRVTLAHLASDEFKRIFDEAMVATG